MGVHIWIGQRIPGSLPGGADLQKSLSSGQNTVCLQEKDGSQGRQTLVAIATAETWAGPNPYRQMLGVCLALIRPSSIGPLQYMRQLRVEAWRGMLLLGGKIAGGHAGYL